MSEKHIDVLPGPDLEDLDRVASQEFIPRNAEAAWMLQLIKINLEKTSLPDDIKQSFLNDITPYITNASMTKLTRGEVKLFLGEFEELWMKYKIFVFRKKFTKELSYVKTLIRGFLMQNYNKSIDGWQGDHVFERKMEYKIKQTQRQDFGEQMKGFFHKKEKHIEEEY